MYKKSLLVLVILFFWSLSASASLVSYNVTIAAQDFFGTGAYGLSGQNNSFMASLTVDNTKTNAAALVDFSLVTGSNTWDESQLDSSVFTTSFSFDALGELLDGWTIGLRDAPGFLILASNDTINIQDGRGFYACNGCVDFSRAGVVNVPEPALPALIGLGLALMAATRRFKKTAK